MPDASQSTIESPVSSPPGELLAHALANPTEVWPDVVLRDHQLEALDELAGRLQHGATRTWVDAPTGSGKTVMFLALAAALGGSALVLVPRRNLAEQTTASLARHFSTVPSQPDGPASAGRPGVTVCTYQAALRHQDTMDWDGITLLICDEAHAALGPQTRRLPDRADNAVLVGFPATASTTTRHVEQVFGPVATTLDRLSAIERGILCPLRSLRVERAVDLSDVARVRGDFDQASLGRALDRARWHRACADVWAEHFQPLGLAGVAYTATVAQAHALADELSGRGVRAAAVSGQTAPRELKRILFDFSAGRIDVLCNADLLTEGWDETRASVVMHLAPTTSERVFVQRLGRVMRPAPDKEAVSVEFLPMGDPMGVQTSHDVFGLGWYRPLGRVAGPPGAGERGALSKAAALLAEQDGGRAKLVNAAAAPGLIAAGLAGDGWRAADPGMLPHGLMEEWIEAASHDVTLEELIETVTAGVDPAAAAPWWALSALAARKLALNDGTDQPLWRAWATALLVQPDLRRALPDDVPRRVLDRLRMSSRERLRALWWHAAVSGRWERLAALEQLGRSGDRRRRWNALEQTADWAPSWAWDVARALADNTRPGRKQEAARIAAWEAHHLITNGGELAVIALWLRAAGEPPPDPVPPKDPGALRLGQAARLLMILGPGDVPLRAEHLRLAARAAQAVGGWAELRGALDALDLSGADGKRALRAAVGATQPSALNSRRAWNALRARFPRLPEPEVIGIGEGRKRSDEESGSGNRRRRRRRRLRTPAADGSPQALDAGASAGAAAPEADTPQTDGAEQADSHGAPTRRRRRRRRRRPSASNGASASAEAPAEAGGQESAAPDGGD